MAARPIPSAMVALSLAGAILVGGCGRGASDNATAADTANASAAVGPTDPGPLANWKGDLPKADPARGALLYAGHGAPAGSGPACIGCHGAKGGGKGLSSNAPRLAGMDPLYLGFQLRMFATKGGRPYQAMNDVSHTLSPQDAADIAAYLAGVKAPAGPRAPQPAALREQGSRIFMNGARGAVACVSCHGAGGQGGTRRIPAIAGQPAIYLTEQLTAMRQGARNSERWGRMMDGEAHQLTDAQIKALAAYLSTLPPANLPPPEKPTS